MTAGAILSLIEREARGALGPVNSYGLWTIFCEKCDAVHCFPEGKDGPAYALTNAQALEAIQAWLDLDVEARGHYAVGKAGGAD